MSLIISFAKLDQCYTPRRRSHFFILYEFSNSLFSSLKDLEHKLLEVVDVFHLQKRTYSHACARTQLITTATNKTNK